MIKDYKIKYYLNYNYHKYSKDEEYLEIIDIIPVFKLLDIELEEKYKNKIYDTLIIEPQKFKNIALIPVNRKNIDKCVLKGAKLVFSTELYDTEIDARIQLAFVCSKYMVEPTDVFDSTNGLLTSKSYKELLKIFYDDFPEKYI